MKLIYLAVMTLISLSTYGQEFCPEQLQVTGTTQVHQFFARNTCYISISTKNTPNMVYRSYVLTNKSTLLVFNSYGDGPYETFTGSSQFYFFPRGGTFGYKILSSGSIEVSLLSGHSLLFSPTTGQIESMSGGQISVDPFVTPQNEGGVKIIRHSGLYLNVGYLQGGSPESDLNAKSKFVDRNNTICELKNSDIFIKINGDTELKHATDQDLAKFLKKKCRKLDLSDL